MTREHQKVSIFVDKASQQWIVRDPEGAFWVVPVRDQAWDNRQPYFLTESSELVAVPRHYQYMLGLPF